MSTRFKRGLSEVLGIIFVAISVFFFISLIYFDPKDISLNSYNTVGSVYSNKGGLVGCIVSDIIVQLFGSSGYSIVLIFLILGFSLIASISLSRILPLSFGIFLIFFSAGIFLNITVKEDPLFGTHTPGGLIGSFVSNKLLLPFFSYYGTILILIMMLSVSFVLIVRSSSDYDGLYRLYIDFKYRLEKLISFFGSSFYNLREFARRRSEKVSYDEDEEVELHYFDDQHDEDDQDSSLRLRSLVLNPDYEDIDERLYPFRNLSRSKDRRNLSSFSGQDLEGPKDDFSEFEDIDLDDESFAGRSGSDYDEDQILVDESVVSVIDQPLKISEPFKDTKLSAEDMKKKQKQQEFFDDKGLIPYEYPDIDLLDKNDIQKKDIDREDLVRSSRILEQKLQDFGVSGKVTQVRPGPVITVYEYEPAAGVKVSKIVSLADDLAMSLKALSIRVEAPIPGKSVVGIEAPTLEREDVYLSDVIASEAYVNSKGILPIGLGKDLSGKVVVEDLARIPHLLVAGSTGSGKSVGVNGMIGSILFRRSPEDVRLLLIDPKMLELSIYDDIPHLITPVVTEAKKASVALKWVVSEMERRYKLMSMVGVRNISKLNEKVKKNLKVLSDEDIKRMLNSSDVKAETVCEKLPYIVVVIDELADLMMVASKDVEDSLARIAQMARAAGIHIIAATQRPSVDVLTGLIKANFPARISFQVRSRVDSRTILDEIGAEKLLGRGDMLYLPPGVSTPVRIQSPFVSDEEIHRIVRFIKDQREPNYIYDVCVDKNKGLENDISSDEYDELYDKAVDIVKDLGQASVSMIQRRLRIGYNRAARIVELMEREGIVGPSDGIKPRDVLIGKVNGGMNL